MCEESRCLVVRECERNGVCMKDWMMVGEMMVLKGGNGMGK